MTEIVVREHRPLAGAVVTVPIATIIAITNTADRLYDDIGDGRSAGDVFGGVQARQEVETFFEFSRALGRVFSTYLREQEH